MNSGRLMNADFGNLIRKHRNMKGFSQIQLARLAEISPSYISRIELGERLTVNYQIVVRLRNLLNISHEIIDDLNDLDGLLNGKST